MNHRQALRLTPSNSPFFKSSTPKSPTKSKGEEPGLRLKKVIGTTTASANGFDCLPSARQLAYTAGAAAVVCTVEDDLKVSQRFFRARPTHAAGSREVNGHGAISPTPGDARNRVFGSIRDQGIGGSPLGASGRDWSDSPSGKSATAKDRVKAATSLALSPNGKWIAVGETGYKPRVLIFSNRGDSSETPVCALAEHTFGVHALAFSPDSRYLASLGTVNDGFLYVWTIDDRTGVAALHSSNKCTVTINSMIWVGPSILTAGLRFVKFWRPVDEPGTEHRNSDTITPVGTPKQRVTDFGNSILSPKHKVLLGKNSLLGDLIDASFISVLALSDDRAIVCAESGEVCLLDDCQKAQTLTVTGMMTFRINAAALTNEGVLIVGASGHSKTLRLEDLVSPLRTKSVRRQTMSPSKALLADSTATVAVAAIDGIRVELDSRRGIRLSRFSGENGPNDGVASHQLAAHNDAVLGVRIFTCESLPEAAFLTFSSNGSIKIWDASGENLANFTVPVETSTEMYDMTNELKAVTAIQNGSILAAGDRYGTLSLLEARTGSVKRQIRAHSTEVNDIVAFEKSGIQLIASASRDRTVQLFSCNEDHLHLLQTMDEHAAAVTGLLVAEGGDLLLSCSSDRTIVVREAVSKPDEPSFVAFAMMRTIVLKSSPTSMCISAESDEILVSTVDRNVGTHNIKSGQAGFNFKCSDADGGESVPLSKIFYAPSLNSNPTIIGVSSGDKSVRLYSEYGSLIARDWGHTEGITDFTLLPSKLADDGEQDIHAQLVTVATDSTVFLWDTVSNMSKPAAAEREVNGMDETPTAHKQATQMGPPLRKVLSFSELSHFRRSRSTGDDEPPSTINTPTQPPPSPPRLKKKTSRMTVAQPPRLEPAFRSNFAEPSRRRSLRKRSPSPPSPRSAAKKELSRKPSLGMSLRSKSSENVLTTASMGGNSGFGSLTSSTDSVCRTLRAYRKKLANSPSSDNIAPDVFRELEKELKLTAKVVGERSHGKNLNEATITKLLDQASDKIVSRLDERIKERVETEVRRSNEGSPRASDSPAGIETQDVQMEAVAGALEKVVINDG